MKLEHVLRARETVRQRLRAAGIELTAQTQIEVTDFGLGHYEREGLGLVVRVNDEYCSKWLVLEPGQECPIHYHKVKKETFFLIRGDVVLEVGNSRIGLALGESYTIQVGVLHSFRSVNGCVVEEVSTHDENSDSYFENKLIVRDTVIEA